MNKSFRFVYIFAAFFLFPRQALAHVPFEGLSDLYNGILHPMFVPAHVLMLIAAGLYLGKHGSKIPAVLMVFILFTAAGLAAAGFSLGGEVEPLLLGGAAIVGLLVSANFGIPKPFYLIIAALTGFIIGLDSAQDSLIGKARIFSLLGSGFGICFLFLYPLAFADYFGDKNWQKIGIRIVGSWVAASSFLVLALSLSSIMN